MSYNEQMTSQNAPANAKLLFKALAAREAYLDEPIPNIRITDVAVQIGLEGDEFDLALDYAADQGWFEDGAGALAHDPSDRVNNGGIYGILAYD